MSAPSDDMEMEKMAEEELSKLQRQFRVMDVDRSAVGRSARPTIRRQRAQVRDLTADLNRVTDQLRLTRGATALLRVERSRNRLRSLLAEHENCAARVKAFRADITELDFLSKQVQREIKRHRSKGSGLQSNTDTATNQTIVAQLENRLNTAMTKFNSVNSENYNIRLQIDRLLVDRTFFNDIWKRQVKRSLEGKAQILELVEQAIGTFEQREEWCAKLDALKEKAAVDYRKHCLEVRELQRQLDHSMKLEEFLRTKGTVRLTAADAKAEAKKLERQEMETRTYNNYVDILDALKEYTGEDDVGKLMQEFTRREEENYALFNYINEVNSELKNLSDNVKTLKTNIAVEHANHQAKLCKQQDSIEALRTTLEEKINSREALEITCAKTKQVLAGVLGEVQKLAASSQCDSLPLLKLLGESLEVNESNARLYIKSLEKKITECADLLRLEERLAEVKERTPPASRRRRRPTERSPRCR